MTYIIGAGLTRFGRHEGLSSIDLMSQAAQAALIDAGTQREEIDAVICGYSGTEPHLMLANAFSEHFGLTPKRALACQSGGATGLTMVAMAERLMGSPGVNTILVVAGENRLSGQSRDQSVQMLAGVGHPRYEAPLGATVPAYYALLASRYLSRWGRTEADLASLAVTMRRHATRHAGAHLAHPITVEDVLGSKPIADPLKILDCCPISDGAAALVISNSQPNTQASVIRGVGHANLNQHLGESKSLDVSGAGLSAAEALSQAGVEIEDIDYAAIYDSFTITLALLLEEIGISAHGRAGDDARAGRFDLEGELPLNTHGGLLSYGHCGVAGGMSHLIEAHLQLSGEAGQRAISTPPGLAFVHADGGVLSAHVSIVLEAA